jgi:GrpB-like predicted nucleotidyltransferase (UPF0157 family)
VGQDFEFGLIGGVELREIVLVEYDAAWAERFVIERQRISEALGSIARMIEHVGSTSVPGLAAKPVVDIQVTVDDPNDEASYGPALERAGYEIRVREPDHRMFRTPERDVHVHIWKANSDDERRHLIFRNHLRRHAEDREAYEYLKRELAPQFQDTNEYAQAKTTFIEEIVVCAKTDRPLQQ